MTAEWNLKNLNSGEVIEITETLYRAGRSNNFEIVCLSRNVSRIHAQFTLESGNFYVVDMNSANGTYVNSKRIKQKEQIQHGDIVGLGFSNLSPANDEPQYVFEVVKIEDILKILQSGDVEEDIVNDTITLNNSNINQPKTPPRDEICRSSNLEIHCNERVLTSSEQATSETSELQESENQTEKVESSEVSKEQASSSPSSNSTTCDGLISEMQIKTEKEDFPEFSIPVEYSVDDDIIVIEDDDDCNLSSSQLFTTSVINDYLLDKIKVELEEIHRDDAEKLIIIDDSDSESDWLGSENVAIQISKLEEELNQKIDESHSINEDMLPILTSSENTNDPATDKPNSNASTSLPKIALTNNISKYIKPPIIEPIQMPCKSLTGKKNNTISVKNFDNTTKRKSEGNEHTKSKRLKSSNSKTNKERLLKLQTSRSNYKRKLDGIDKEEKEKIKQIRKKKLKELETKCTDKSKTYTTQATLNLHKEVSTSYRHKEANVKVSSSRGDFLLENKVTAHVQQKTKIDKTNNTVNLSRKDDSNHSHKENLIALVKSGKNGTVTRDPGIYKIPHVKTKKKTELIGSKSNDTFNNCQQVRNHTENLIAPVNSVQNETKTINNNNARDPRTYNIEPHVEAKNESSKSKAIFNNYQQIHNQTENLIAPIKCVENETTVINNKNPRDPRTYKTDGEIKRESSNSNGIINNCQQVRKQPENLIAPVKSAQNETTMINNKNSRDPRTHKIESHVKTKQDTVLTSSKLNIFSSRQQAYSSINDKNNSRMQFLSLDVILNIINWKAKWLEEQVKIAVPPPVNKRTPVKMCYSFSSHNDYCNVVNSLLTLELWNVVYKEWLCAVNETRPESRFWGSIESVEPQCNYILLKCITYITKEQKDTRKHVKESDVVLINLPLLDPNKSSVKKIFAYVSSCSKKLLHSDDYIDSFLAKQLIGVPNSILTLDIMIRCIPEKISLEGHFEGGIITSLVVPLREFDAVKALRDSPLCKYILDPKIEDYLVPCTYNKQIISKDNLCESQQLVVSEAVSLNLRDSPGIYLIQGPPGTGKTTVITNIVHNILLNEEKKASRLLLVAPSNAAVDGIILKINKQIKPHLTEHERRKIKLLRIGPKHAIHDEVKPYFLDELARDYVNRNFFGECPEVWKDYCQLCKDKQRLAQEIHHEKGLGHNTREREKQLQELKYKQDNFAKIYLKQKYFERFSGAKKLLIEGANIICTTLSSCVRLEEHNLSLGKITCCIVDEATKSKEPETLIPLMLGIKKLILVGDPQQLPAVTVSQYAKELGHGQSLFARIKHHFGNKPHNPIRMLNIQYRMHPQISLFPSNNFYNGELLNSPTYIQREGLDKLAAYYVFNLNSKSHLDGYTNEDEVDCVAKLLNAITSVVGVKLSYSVGIITPYNTQKDALNKRLVNYSKNSDVSICVNTVDSFQGSEKDVVILSCVRYNPNSFLSDEQRLNVAITRAKHAFYIIGTYSLFQHCATLSRIKRDAEKRNLYRNINCSVKTNVLQAVIATK